MLLGLVGPPNAGKSTLFNALTHGAAEVANYPFTTIDPNRGVAFATTPCPHADLRVTCKPKAGACVNGARQVPVNLVDVAGLVPGAHEGKGRGNQFLNDLSAADALVAVVDASGATDDHGNMHAPGTQNPAGQLAFLEDELDRWLAGVLERNAAKHKQRPLADYAQSLSGLRVTQPRLERALNALSLPPTFWDYGATEFLLLARRLRAETKPLVVAANKVDGPAAEKNVLALKQAFPNHLVVPVSGDAELALRKAAEKGWVRYNAGDADFTLLQTSLPAPVLAALEQIRSNVLQRFGGTGAQALVNAAVFQLLRAVAVFPVEDEHKYANHFGDVLPDALLLPPGATPIALAEKIHSDLARGFLHAVDARKKRRVGKDHALATGDVIKIVSAR